MERRTERERESERQEERREATRNMIITLNMLFVVLFGAVLCCAVLRLRSFFSGSPSVIHSCVRLYACVLYMFVYRCSLLSAHIYTNDEMNIAIETLTLDLFDV